MGVIEVVEAACSLEDSTHEWMERLTDAVCDATGGRPTLGVRHQWPEDGTLELSPFSTRGLDAEHLEGLMQALGDLTARHPRTVRRFYCGLHVATMSQRAPELGFSSDEVTDLLATYDRLHIGDLRALCGADPEGSGVLFTSIIERRALSKSERQRWKPVAAHLTANARLRRRSEPEPEVVLEPSGRVVHAVGEGRAPTAREQLAMVCRAMERARTRAGRARPDESLESWRAMVDGRWTVVERVDTDSRRYLLAIENAPSCRRALALSPREETIVERVATGRSNKLIAYELGSSEGTVASIVHTAMAKLGARNRAALTDIVLRAWATQAIFDPDPSDEPTLTSGPRPAREGLLSPTERELVASIRAGRSDKAIADERGVSRKTVRNQLHALYRRAGVSSRAELLHWLDGHPPQGG